MTDPDDASNAADDAMISVLEDHRDDPVVQEIAATIFAMSQDEQVDLVTLAWLGRGDGSIEDWDELRAEATRAHNNAPRPICSACRFLPIISMKRFRSSAIRATSDAGVQHAGRVGAVTSAFSGRNKSGALLSAPAPPRRFAFEPTHADERGRQDRYINEISTSAFFGGNKYAPRTRRKIKTANTSQPCQTTGNPHPQP